MRAAQTWRPTGRERSDRIFISTAYIYIHYFVRTYIQASQKTTNQPTLLTQKKSYDKKRSHPIPHPSAIAQIRGKNTIPPSLFHDSAFPFRLSHPHGPSPYSLSHPIARFQLSHFPVSCFLFPESPYTESRSTIPHLHWIW
jgi:hypothetical protein